MYKNKAKEHQGKKGFVELEDVSVNEEQRVQGDEMVEKNQ